MCLLSLPTCGHQMLYCLGDLATQGFCISGCSWAGTPVWVPLDPTLDHLPFSTALGLAAPLRPLLGLCHLAALWVWPEAQSGDGGSEDGALVLQLPTLEALESRVPSFHPQHHCLRGTNRECGPCKPKAARYHPPT